MKRFWNNVRFSAEEVKQKVFKYPDVGMRVRLSSVVPTGNIFDVKHGFGIRTETEKTDSVVKNWNGVIIDYTFTVTSIENGVVTMSADEHTDDIEKALEIYEKNPSLTNAEQNSKLLRKLL